MKSHRKLEEAALTVRQELLGKEHPETLASVNDLANVVSRQGQGQSNKTLPSPDPPRSRR
jgi:hypothetical protein